MVDVHIVDDHTDTIVREVQEETLETTSFFFFRFLDRTESVPLGDRTSGTGQHVHPDLQEM